MSAIRTVFSQQGVQKEIGQQRKVVAPLQQKLVKKSFFFLYSIYLHIFHYIQIISIETKYHTCRIRYIDQHKSADDAEILLFLSFCKSADYFVLAAFVPKTKIMKTEISAASGASLCIIALGEVETNIGKIPPMLPSSLLSSLAIRIFYVA